MLKTFENNTLFIMPLCFHPTTSVLVDDDVAFLNDLVDYFSERLSVKPFNNADEAIDYINSANRPTLFKERCTEQKNGRDFPSLSAIRKEIYNADRFKEVLTSVIDYNMPNKNGFDLMRSIGIPLGGLAFHSYILLTGTEPSAWDKDFASSFAIQNLISKADPEYQNKLLKRIQEKSNLALQWCSYDLARPLAADPNEHTNFLFDGNFLPLFKTYLKENKICEFYLFDRQGSFLLLDEHANLSWLFVRNETGVENSIKLAAQHHAPQHVLDALKSKQVILSLYEQEDFAQRKNIDWDKYLLPATVFSGDDAYTSFFNLGPHSSYYYAFTNSFPEHGLKKENILSYREFLKKNQ